MGRNFEIHPNQKEMRIGNLVSLFFFKPLGFEVLKVFIVENYIQGFI